MEKIIKSRIQSLHGTEAEWNAIPSFVPKESEIVVYDTDNDHANPRLKIGDGVTTVVNLPFVLSMEVVDNLTSTDSSLALSAKQGKLLKSEIDKKLSTSTTINSLYGISSNGDQTMYAIISSAGSGEDAAGGIAQRTSHGSLKVPTTSIVDSTDVTNKDYVDSKWPVGSIYISVNSVSPATIYGGTWERIKDKFLLAAGDTYAAGEVGGEAEHILIEEEIPAHDHEIEEWTMVASYKGITGRQSLPYLSSNSYNGNVNFYSHEQTDSKSGRAEYSSYVDTYPNGRRGEPSGGGLAHNNMPPFKAYYMWERIA